MFDYDKSKLVRTLSSTESKNDDEQIYAFTRSIMNPSSATGYPLTTHGTFEGNWAQHC